MCYAINDDDVQLGLKTKVTISDLKMIYGRLKQQIYLRAYELSRIYGCKSGCKRLIIVTQPIPRANWQRIRFVPSNLWSIYQWIFLCSRVDEVQQMMVRSNGIPVDQMAVSAPKRLHGVSQMCNQGPKRRLTT